MKKAFIALGPTDPHYPCDRDHPHPRGDGCREWHVAEANRMVTRWLNENPEASLVEAKTRNDASPGWIHLFVDITYEAPTEGMLAIQNRKEERERRIQEYIAQRKAEYEEQERKQEIQSSRRRTKLCVMCGKPLPFFARFFGPENHKECKLFTE